MAKQIIAVDIDDVLTYSALPLVEYGNKRFGLSGTIDDFDENLMNLWRMTHEQVEEEIVLYLTSGELEKLLVIPEALDVLRELKKNYQLIALTSRRDIVKDITKEYLDTHYPTIFEAIYHSGIYGTGKGEHTQHKLTKADRLQEVGANYLIDDQPKHCIGASEIGVKSILFGDYKWNRVTEPFAKGITRCRDWASVLTYFEGENDE